MIKDRVLTKRKFILTAGQRLQQEVSRLEHIQDTCDKRKACSYATGWPHVPCEGPKLSPVNSSKVVTRSKMPKMKQIKTWCDYNPGQRLWRENPLTLH